MNKNAQKSSLDYEICKKWAKTMPNMPHTELRELESLDLSTDIGISEYTNTQTKKEGFPVSVKKNADDKLTVYRYPNLCHTLTIGNSGSGKSQGWHLNQLFNEDGTKSLIIFDPKSELCTFSYNHIRKLYPYNRCIIINLMDPDHSMVHINPLMPMAQEWLSAALFKPAKRQKIWEQIVNEVRKFVDILFPVTIERDPSWENKSKQFIFAEIIAAFEDLTLTPEQEKSTGRKRTTPEEINLYNIRQIFHKFKWEKSYGSNNGFDDGGFFTSRDDNSLAKKTVQAIICDAASTRANDMGFVDQHLNLYADPKIEKISMFNDWDITELAKKPMAVYIIYDLSDVAVREFVNKYVAYAINKLLEYSHSLAKPLDVPVLIYADEFPTLKPCDVYPNLLATGRGSRIFMNLTVQSLSQLKARYPDEYESMVQNCDVTAFFGTNDYQTAKTFVAELGDTTVPDPVAFLQGKFTCMQVPVVTPDYLMHNMTQGEIFVKINHQNPIHGYFEYFYKTNEYNSTPKFDLNTVKHISKVSLRDCTYNAPWMHKVGKTDDDELDDIFDMLDEDETKADENVFELDADNNNWEEDNVLNDEEEKEEDDYLVLPLEERVRLKADKIIMKMSVPFKYKNEEEFENQCMDIIEEIVGLSPKQERVEAIEIAKIVLNKYRDRKADKNELKVLERVLHEFEIATNDEYNLLRKQIFED